jgi:ubiquitin C-terminal hydrolase
MVTWPRVLDKCFSKTVSLVTAVALGLYAQRTVCATAGFTAVVDSSRSNSIDMMPLATVTATLDDCVCAFLDGEPVSAGYVVCVAP